MQVSKARDTYMKKAKGDWVELKTKMKVEETGTGPATVISSF